MAFEFPVTVRFQHCDAAGIVFYPRYFEMLNTCVETWFEQCIDVSYANMHIERKQGVPTVHIDSNFHKASRLEDRLTFHLDISKLGSKSLDLAICIKCADELRASFNITLVFVDLETMQSIPWRQCEDIYTGLQRALAEATGSAVNKT